MRGIIKSLEALDRTPVGNVSDLSIKAGNGKITIKWADPQDENWKGTKLVYKLGSYPTNINDGIQILDNKEKDKYKENGFTKEEKI